MDFDFEEMQAELRRLERRVKQLESDHAKLRRALEIILEDATLTLSSGLKNDDSD